MVPFAQRMLRRKEYRCNPENTVNLQRAYQEKLSLNAQDVLATALE
jgi:hypothetical protein